MTIKASEVKLLREKTGLGMMECKKALIESDGDIEAAIVNLRKNSALKAEKNLQEQQLREKFYLESIRQKELPLFWRLIVKQIL